MMGPVEVTFIPDPDNLPRRGPTVCFTELLNHRQAEVGRDPWVPLVPSCPSRHTLSRAQHHVQAALGLVWPHQC